MRKKGFIYLRRRVVEMFPQPFSILSYLLFKVSPSHTLSTDFFLFHGAVEFMPILIAKAAIAKVKMTNTHLNIF